MRERNRGSLGVHIRPTKALRLGRIAHKAGLLPAGTFEDKVTGSKVEVIEGMGGRSVDLKQQHNDQTTRTSINISQDELGIMPPYISAVSTTVTQGEVVSELSYGAEKTWEDNSMTLHEVAKAIRFAGRICTGQNIVRETTD